MGATGGSQINQNDMITSLSNVGLWVLLSTVADENLSKRLQTR